MADKTNVSKVVKKDPVLLRPAFLPAEIRNRSGNGGGILIGLIPIVSLTNNFTLIKFVT